MKLKLLELFSGSRSIGKIADEKNWDVFSVDNVAYPNTNWVGDIQDWDYRINEMQVGELEEEYVPSFIWASPPCTSFSVASIGRHWVKGHTFLPKTKQAELGVKIFEKTLEIIKYYLELNPDLVWFIENPRGKMRKAPHWETIPHTRHTVMYCRYGKEEKRMKPTDLWTNAEGFVAKTCKSYKYDKDGNIINRHCHHESAQRGSATGTQGLKGNHERSKIPKELSQYVIEIFEKNIKKI